MVVIEHYYYSRWSCARDCKGRAYRITLGNTSFLIHIDCGGKLSMVFCARHCKRRGANWIIAAPFRVLLAFLKPSSNTQETIKYVMCDNNHQIQSDTAFMSCRNCYFPDNNYFPNCTAWIIRKQQTCTHP